MKVGTENRKQIGLLVVLALVAIFVLARMYSGKPAVSARVPVPGAATSTPKKSTSTSTAKRMKKLPLVETLDPTLRFDLLKSSEDQQYTGGKRNIFEPQMADIPQPVASAIKKEVVVPQPQLPPPPPPINLKFYGFASRPGEPKRVFLTSGDDVFIGSEGEIVNRHYKIVRISNSSVEIEDVLNNNKQTIPLTQG